MKSQLFSGGGFGANGYLVTDRAGTAGVMIDPSVPYDRVMAGREAAPAIRYLLLTHAHFDHLLYLSEWKARTGAPVAIMAADAPALLDGDKNGYRLFFGQDFRTVPADCLLEDGQVLIFGEQTLEVVATPGHTKGSCCFLCGDSLYTGDTIFAGGDYGRTDLWGGDEAALFASIRKLCERYAHCRIYPGHGGSSTMAQELPYYR
ncbi:MAG: MBL fold metallo-hydrolase [Eubacteriales bacterium]